MVEFPDDADGGALRRTLECGSDMSKPMYINFQVAAPDDDSARAIAKVAGELGYRVQIYESAECRLQVTCECSTRMVATYGSVIAIQQELAIISKPFGGIPDGWGTFGNGPNGQPPVD
jgi:regulator of RNase E activity RraB